MILPAFVTTSGETNDSLKADARGLASRLGLPYVHRGSTNVDQLRGLAAESGVEGASDCGYLVVERRRIALRWGDEEFFFHPSMAVLRIRAARKGGHDHMAAAMALAAGMTVLDCTLGLGSDAIVASFMCQGGVVGLEASPVIHEVVAYGLERYSSGDAGLDEAMRRIRVVNADHKVHMRLMPDDSFDCVYFDPMFRQSRPSASMEPMRCMTVGDAVSPESIREAVRVAKRRVVLKEARGSAEFERLGFDRVEGGRYSEVAYGVLDVCR